MEKNAEIEGQNDALFFLEVDVQKKCGFLLLQETADGRPSTARQAGAFSHDIEVSRD